MQLIVLVCVLLAAAVQQCYTAVPTRCQEIEAEKKCLSLIKKDLALLPGVVRLAFHDCVGDGGCNGCIDITNKDNGGLKRYVDTLEAAYVDLELGGIMSRADFWVLCSFVAIKEGHQRSRRDLKNPPPLVMRYGRKDCSAETPFQVAPGDKYPSPHGHYNKTTGYFNRQFGLSEKETIALLGAHTLGRARRENSGFINQWVAGEFSFDNQYYKDMLESEIKWVQVNDSDSDNDPHWQWVHNSTKQFLMFNSDMSFVKDVRPDANGRVTETFQDIPKSPGYSVSLEYAIDNRIWLNDFAVAYTKMIEKLPASSEHRLVPAIYTTRFIEMGCASDDVEEMGGDSIQHSLSITLLTLILASTAML